MHAISLCMEGGRFPFIPTFSIRIRRGLSTRLLGLGYGLDFQGQGRGQGPLLLALGICAQKQTTYRHLLGSPPHRFTTAWMLLLTLDSYTTRDGVKIDSATGAGRAYCATERHSRAGYESMTGHASVEK